MRAKQVFVRKQEGAILVMSLLLLAMIASIAFAVSSIVYRSITIERAYDDSIMSFYAAESGLERALDIVAHHRAVSDTIASTESVIESYATFGAPYTLPNTSTTYWIDSILTQQGVSAYRLPVSSRAQIELFNPDASFDYVDVESIRWLWNMPSVCPATSRLEASFFKYDSTSIGLADDLVYKQVFTCGAETPETGYDCQATSNYPTINTNYIVSLWSMDCDLIDLTTTAYDADNASGGVVDIPSIVQLSAAGGGVHARRNITAVIKWIPSASGLTEFVLFSQEAVTK